MVPVSVLPFCVKWNVNVIDCFSPVARVCVTASRSADRQALSSRSFPSFSIVFDRFQRQLLRATVGFTLVARRAGTRHATSAMRMSTIGDTMNVTGSRVPTP